MVRVFRDKDWTLINDLHLFVKDWSKHQIKIFGDKFGDDNMGLLSAPFFFRLPSDSKRSNYITPCKNRIWEIFFYLFFYSKKIGRTSLILTPASLYPLRCFFSYSPLPVPSSSFIFILSQIIDSRAPLEKGEKYPRN
jgi:hypothetical protein